MADFEKVAYTFPDEQEKKADKNEAPEFEIEVVDDTPAEDKGRKPSDPPADPTDEELNSYSEGVKKRIQHFTKGYHDERRAKEAAQREKDEALRIAQAVAEENQRLKGSLNQGQMALLDQAKKVTATEVEAAKRKLKEAQEAFDNEAATEAQQELFAAMLKADKINNFKPAPVQPQQNAVQPATNVQAPRVDPKAAEWQEANQWFGKDREMTSFALGLHEKLVVEDGLNPQSDDYYKRINARMRQVFPEKFDSDEPGDAPSRRPKSNVVAPATRSTAPKKIVLTQTQVGLARRLGIPLTEYARQVAKLNGN